MRKTILGGALAAMLAAAPAHATVFSISIPIDPSGVIYYPDDGGLWGVHAQGTFDPVTINPGDSLEVTVTFAPSLDLHRSGTFGLALKASKSPIGGAVGGPPAFFHQVYNGGQDRLEGLSQGFFYGENAAFEVLPAGLVDVVHFGFAYVGPAFPNSEIVLGGYQFGEFTAPEPSTWAMILIGFAGAGFVGYRRRRMSVA